MSEFRVRLARAHELAAVGELVVEAYRVDGYLDSEAGTRYAEHLRDAASRAADTELLVAAGAAGELLGSVTLVPPDSAYAEVSRPGEVEFRMLATTRAARGRGVGEALVRAVVDRARQQDAARVVLCSLAEMVTAHRLYRRLGFTHRPDRDWEAGPEVRLLTFGFELG